MPKLVLKKVWNYNRGRKLSVGSYLCSKCGIVFLRRRLLTNHLKQRHKMTAEDNYLLLNERPLCKCGCGQYTNWNSGRHIYSDFITGHNGKFSLCPYKKGNIPWNKGLTKETDIRIKNLCQKATKTLVEKYKKGELVPWSKGLTKEVDSRLIGISLKASERQRGKKQNWPKEVREKWLNSIRNSCKVKERREKVKEDYRTGRKVVWNKGLTKETDERVRILAEKLKGHSPAKRSGVGKSGYREDIDLYVRSRWEANYARFLKFIGVAFEYEPFWFEFSDKTKYTPDFWWKDYGVFIEIKGYMTEKAKRKILNFWKEWSVRNTKVGFGVCGSDEYYRIEREYGHLIPNWEFEKEYSRV